MTKVKCQTLSDRKLIVAFSGARAGWMLLKPKLTERMTIRLPCGLAKAVAVYARQKKWSQGNAIRNLIEDGLTRTGFWTPKNGR